MIKVIKHTRWRSIYRLRFGLVLNVTFNNISVISWWSVLLKEEIEIPRENHQSVASHWQTFTHNVVLSTLRHEWCSNGWRSLNTKVNNLIWFENCNLIGCSAWREFWLYLITWVSIVTSPTYSFANDKFK
jgi:hypothetical protein